MASTSCISRAPPNGKEKNILIWLVDSKLQANKELTTLVCNWKFARRLKALVLPANLLVLSVERNVAGLPLGLPFSAEESFASYMLACSYEGGENKTGLIATGRGYTLVTGKPAEAQLGIKRPSSALKGTCPPCQLPDGNAQRGIP